MKIKPGVTMAGLSPRMRIVLIYAEKIWKTYDEELVVTSALDGEHSAGSLHYYGYALDLRTRYFTPEAAAAVARELSDELTRIDLDFRVIKEKTHIHVQHQGVIR